MNVREIALKLLCEYEAGGKYVNLSLNSHLTDKLSGAERSFLTALLYTSVERKLTYDYWIAAIAGRSIDKIDDVTKNILRLGLCQITAFDVLPDFAAVNETVKLSRTKGERSFVNGILRNAVRTKNDLPLPDPKKNYARYLSVRYSYPLWLVKHFMSELGEEGCEKILSCYNFGARYTDLTVNTVKISRDAYIDLLFKEGISAQRSPFSSYSIRISESVDPRRLPGFNDGLFFVQDSSCAASVELVDAFWGMKLCDVCACPGGKSFAAAVMADDKCKIYSFDLHESKLSLIADGAERLGLESIEASVVDALVGSETLLGQMDRVICDVPCSGLGVLSKKPDIRYKDPEDIRELPALQLSILKKSSQYLKADGELIYSTCTLNTAENRLVVEAFLEEMQGFEPVDFNIGDYRSENGMFTFIPNVHYTDGFFVAKLRKKLK